MLIFTLYHCQSILARQHDHPVLMIPAGIKCEIWVEKAKQLTLAADTQNSEHSHLKSTKLSCLKATEQNSNKCHGISKCCL